MLVEHFLRKLEAQIGVRFNVAPEAYHFLMQHDWPGNVRELENVIERSVVYANARNESTLTGSNILLGRGVFENNFAPHRAGELDAHAVGRLPMNAFAPVESFAPNQTLEQAEYQSVMAALHEAGYVHTTAARILKIHRNTLRNKLAAFRAKGYAIPEKVAR